MPRSIPIQKKRTKPQHKAALKAASARPGGPCQDVLDRVAAIAATRPQPKPMPVTTPFICMMPSPYRAFNPVEFYLTWLRTVSLMTTIHPVAPWIDYAALYGVRR